ncbi:hypothetical protein OK016_08555 [Vibrio chagasii]|nr:hypothetical protein [Vibrio chagasii]
MDLNSIGSGFDIVSGGRRGSVLNWRLLFGDPWRGCVIRCRQNSAENEHCAQVKH